jgi:hypothetical protein
VPWFVSLLESAGGIETARAAVSVGDDVPLAAWGSDLSAPVEIVGPEGQRFPVTPGTALFSNTMEPGLYSVTVGGKVRRVAVNLDPIEGRTTPLAADELERLGAPTAPTASPGVPAVPKADKTVARLDSSAEEGRQKLWRWFLVATLVVLFAESGLAGRLARRAVSPAQSA